jgi:hypothetical protein
MTAISNKQTQFFNVNLTYSKYAGCRAHKSRSHTRAVIHTVFQFKFCASAERKINKCYSLFFLHFFFSLIDKTRVEIIAWIAMKRIPVWAKFNLQLATQSFTERGEKRNELWVASECVFAITLIVYIMTITWFKWNKSI